MRRVLSSLGLIAVLVLIPSGVAAAAPTSVAIKPKALFIIDQGIVNVGVTVVCDGGIGSLSVAVQQLPPESTFPASGTRTISVPCDGKKHDVAVTVPGFGFDIGRATVSAVLDAGGVRDAERDVQIVLR